MTTVIIPCLDDSERKIKNLKSVSLLRLQVQVSINNRIMDKFANP